MTFIERYSVMRIRALVIIAFCVFAGIVPAGAQSRPGDRFVWDQPTAELPAIARFELRIDSGAWSDVGKVPAAGVTAPAGLSAYQATVPALVSGNYTFAVRACPLTGACGPEAAPFAFTIVVVTTPRSLRILPGEGS